MVDSCSQVSEFGNGNIDIDPNVIAALPHGSQVTSTEPHGRSSWGDTGRINVELADGTPSSFFIKVLSDEIGRSMVHGEFESMKAIRDVSPDFAPRPEAWGTYRNVPGRHFFLCEYRRILRNKIPSPSEFSEHLATIHKRSRSPNNKFGFHVTSYNGNLPHLNDWEASWETFFMKSMRWALDLEIKARGSDPEFDTLVPVLFDKVIPRLLRPLESDGRSIKPSLVHGDLWYANSGVDAETGQPLVFDACCFYAHHEYEFGQWRPSCNRFGEEYLAAYHPHNPRSEPIDDYDGRLDLYKLRFNTHVSALFMDDKHLRDQMLGDMRDLVERYG